MVTSMNEETALKLSEEKEKFDTMKSSRLELEATLKLKRDLMKEDEVVNKDQDVLI
jgi:hypothetical protein